MRGPYAMLNSAEIVAVMDALPKAVEEPPPDLVNALDKMRSALTYDSDPARRKAFKEPMV